MPSIYVFKRKRKGKTEKVYSAQIRFGEKEGGASYLRSTGATDKREAEAVARRIALEIEKTELPQRGKEFMTVEEMFARWIAEHGHDLRSGRDIKRQIKTIIKYLGSREIRELGNKDIHGFVQDTKFAGIGHVSINRSVARLRATMRYAAKKWEEPVKDIAWSDMLLDEAKARTVYLSPAEAQQLMGLLPQHIALAFAFTLYTGVRLNELQTLIWKRVDFHRGVAEVETKGGGTRIVWLSQKAMRIVTHLFETAAKEQRQPEALVFDLTNHRRYWVRARKKIGRSDVRWHDLRAMTATWARQYAGKDLRLIGQALGHAGTQVTERYARVVDREIVDMLDQLPDIAPQGPEHIRLSTLLSIEKNSAQNG